MSQTSFLEDVVDWDEQKCRAEVNEALPKLITCFGVSECVEEGVGILKILCHMFLPCLQIKLAERKFFSKIAEKVANTADILIDNIKTSAAQQQCSEVKLIELVQQLMDLLDCCELCVKFMTSKQEPLETSSIRSVPVITISLLKSTYTHCKESGEIYRDLITCVSDSLSALFKKAHSLQILLLSMLDKVVLDAQVTDEDIDHLCVVYRGLFVICQIVSALDVKLIVSLWKFLSRSCVEYKEHLKNRLDVDSLIIHLCDEVTSGYEYLFHLVPRLDGDDVILSQGDEKGFQKNVKIVSFEMKILVTFVNEYREYLCGCERNVCMLLLHLHRSLSPCLTAPRIPEKYTDEIKRQLINACEPIVHHLACNQEFYVTLNQKQKDEECLPQLILLLNILDVLPRLPDEVQEKYLSLAEHADDSCGCNIVSSVFYCISKCCVELSFPVMLPGVMCSGKPFRSVSLYEYVCTHLCGFVGSCPSKYFSVLEETIIQNLLSTDFYCVEMAVDIWSYLARYGSAELCFEHCCMLANVCSSCDYPFSVQQSNLFTMLKRLIKFLSSQHREDFYHAFPVKDHLVLWSEIPITSFPSCLRRGLTDTLLKECTDILQGWFSSSCDMKQAWNVVNCLKCIRNIYQQPDVEMICSAENQALVIDIFVNLWNSLTDVSCDNSLFRMMVCHLVQLLASIGHMLQITDTLKFVQRLIALLRDSKTTNDFMKLSMLRFLGVLGKLKLQPCFEQTQILQKLPLLFSNLLTDTDPIIQHKALESFTRFAEDTVHESVVSECMNINSELQDIVIAFINKDSSCISNKEYLCQQKRYFEELTEEKEESEQLQEPSSKRARLESTTEQVSFSMVLHQIEPLVSKLEEMSLMEQPDQEERDRIQITYNKLQNILAKCT